MLEITLRSKNVLISSHLLTTINDLPFISRQPIIMQSYTIQSKLLTLLFASLQENQWMIASQLLVAIGDKISAKNTDSALNHVLSSELKTDTPDQKDLDIILLLATQHKQWNIAEKVLELGADLGFSHGSQNALDYALASEQPVFIQAFLRKSAHSICAASHTSWECVSESKTVQHAQDAAGNTLLHIAAKIKNPAWTTRLLKSGFTKTTENHLHLNPMHIASQCEN